MATKENQVYGVAMQFCKDFPEYLPEGVIYGYAKLLTMDESQVRSFISAEDMGDFETALKWFADTKIDLNLIKSGLALLTPLVPYQEVEERGRQLKAYLEGEEKATKSSDILSKALELAYVSLQEVFATGNELSQVFEWQSKLKEKFDDAPKPTREKAPEVKNPEEKKPAEGAKAETKTEEVQVSKEHNLATLSKKYRDLTLSLLDVVKGQDNAVLKFVQGYNQGELLKQTEKGKQPKTYFFFFGPPGVGKTLLAETAAESLGIPYKLYNMSEYTSSQSQDDLTGSSSMFSNTKEGNLAQFVEDNPECLLVFDEIEKAHPTVIKLFLQILGSGKLHSKHSDKDISFQEATIIFTSNVGKQLYDDRSVNLTTLPEKVLVDSILKEKDAYGAPVLLPEICSRIASGNVVLFNHLSVRHLAEMVRVNFDKIVAGMEKEHGVKVTYAPELPLLFIYNRGGDIDARVAIGQSGRFLKNEIYELLRQLENNSDQSNEIKQIHIGIDWAGMDSDLERLFKKSDKSEVLVFSDNAEMFDSMEEGMYKICRVSTLEKAKKMAQNDIAAVYIDPFFGKSSDEETVLSISDYNTEGVRFFHSLVETQAELPVFLLEMDREFSEVDRRTFLQEGATGTVLVNSAQAASFQRQFTQIMEELYMEKESQSFSQRGLVVDFSTKQEMVGQDGTVRIFFYNLKKRMAVDVESRGSILADAEKPNVKFDDVIGAEKAKEELKYFVNYLTNPKQFLMAGGKPPKGVLLYGPPGTGKTMLAKAMAGESDITFLQTSAAEFKNKYMGESEANIRRIFAKAKKYAPAIIFIDEIDAIGKPREGNGDGFHRAESSMLNALLTEMDGFASANSSKPVFVLAATNFGAGREDNKLGSLDPALLRRFDNKIYVDLPNEKERKQYIMMMLAKKGVNTISEATAQNIAERTTGQSLAIVQNVLELAIRDANKALRSVTDNDLLNALEDYIYGEKKVRTPEYYRKVAIHETGHAYMAYISGDKPTYMTIEARGDFGGYMQHANPEERTGYSREDVIARIRTSLAGRAAEQVFYGKEKSLNTGATSDLQNATEWAWRMLCTFGMEENQLIVLSKEEVLRSSMAADYVAKINGILNEQMAATIAIIEGAKDKIQEIANVLVKENKLTGAQLEKLMENK